jgi:hypothetical protein
MGALRWQEDEASHGQPFARIAASTRGGDSGRSRMAVPWNH